MVTVSIMKSFIKNLRNIAIAGFFFLLPVYVLLILLTKAWTSLSLLWVPT